MKDQKLQNKNTTIFLLILLFTSVPFLGLLIPDVQAQPEPPPNVLFGHTDPPSWLNVTVTEDSEYININTSDGFIYKMGKGDYGYNEIWFNGSLAVEDERWRLEYLQLSGKYRMRGEPQNITFNQTDSGHVTVIRYYDDFDGTTFQIQYYFTGGFHPKIWFVGDIGQEDTYRIVWKASGINTSYIQHEPNNTRVRLWNGNMSGFVFDYSDVYQSFGNITTVEIETSANNHKMDQIFSVGTLPIGTFILDPTFGNTDDGGASRDITNAIKGSKATCPESGTAVSITGRFSEYVGSGIVTFKSALYKVSDDSLVGYTEEQTMDDGDPETELTFNFIGSPALTNIEYYIVAWGDRPSAISCSNAPAGTKVYVDAETYNGFPDPWVPSDDIDERVVNLYCTYVSNNEPINDVCIITNMNDTDNLYAQINLGYQINYSGHDDDGYADVDYIFVNISQGINIRVSFKYDEDINTFSIQSGNTEFTLDGSSSSYRSGNNINLSIIFHVQWDATEEADLEINCTIADDEPTYDHDNMQTDYVDVVTNLLTSSIECTNGNNPDRVDVSSSITIDFSVRYANNPSSATATTLYPPNAEFTSISVYDDEDNNLGTDNTIVNGDGQVTGTSRATVRQTFYNLYINMVDADYSDAEETPNEEVISDQIKILTLGANDTRLDLNGIIELYATSELEYDSHAMGSGDSLTIDGIALSWTIDNFNGTDTESSVLANVYNSGVGTEATYGITAVNMDSKTVTVIWDRLSVSFSVNDSTPEDNVTVTFTVAITRQYDSSSVSSYIYDVNRNGSLFVDDRSTSTFTDINNTVVFIYDFISVTDQTYNLVGFVDPPNLTVEWAIRLEYEEKTYVDITRTILGESSTDYGYALELDGDGSDYIYLNMRLDTNLYVSTNFTVELWGYLIGTPTEYDDLACASYETDGITTSFSGFALRSRVGFVDGVESQYSGTVGEEIKFHVVLTAENTSGLCTLYLNASIEQTDTGTGGFNNLHQRYAIGRDGGRDEDYCHFIVDEFRFYNRTLNQTEVTYSYNSGVGTTTILNDTDLQIWYRFNEGTGTNITDSSGNGNHKTLSGDGDEWVTGLVSLQASIYPSTITITNLPEDFTVKLYNATSFVCEATANSSNIATLTLPSNQRISSFEGTYRVYSPDNTFIYSKWFEDIQGGDFNIMVEATSKGFVLSTVLILLFVSIPVIGVLLTMRRRR